MGGRKEQRDDENGESALILVCVCVVMGLSKFKDNNLKYKV